MTFLGDVMAGLFGDVPYTEDTPDLMAGDVLSDILPWRVYDSEKQLYHFTHGTGFLMEVGSAIGNSELAENIGGVLAAKRCRTPRAPM
ncbi:TraC family protein [Tritonibacter mobilis]|uniref:TraC family protein n=1 Tax=Tritonibacter mobilis TaxID=379347 RepID=UPI00398F9552